MSVTVTLDTKKLQELIRQSPEKADSAVRATAFYVEALAKQGGNYRNQTGANRNSIFTKTSKGRNGTPGELGDVFPDVGLGEAIVAPSMEYSARLEFGFAGQDSLGRTYHQAADPYLYPAMGQAQSFFARVIQEFMKK